MKARICGSTRSSCARQDCIVSREETSPWASFAANSEMVSWFSISKPRRERASTNRAKNWLSNGQKASETMRWGACLLEPGKTPDNLISTIPTMLVQDFLQDSARHFPQKTALVCEGERWTYAQLESMANRLANGFLKF